MKKTKSAKLTAQAALSGVLALSVLSLSACSSKPAQSDVECYGVSKYGNNTAVVMPKGMCEKLAKSRAVEMNANDYVECYGVAAAGKNDCATNSSACGGSVAVDRSPAAWIALPRGICEQLAGAKIGAITSAPGSSSKPAQSSSSPSQPVSKPAQK
ncbi:MAG: Protein of unknown function transrane [Gammaproteobacteria bacterium]|jgi:uncharacterized membrane protein|nr:Protein of unknown function transrane [Gammaproteobacteria bacterium]